MNFGHELHKVASGRIFIRAASAQPDCMRTNQNDYAAATERLRGAILMVGVVEIPKSIEVERLHDVRLNDHLWLDAENSRLPRTYHQGMVREMDAGGVLQDFQFARGFLPDSFEVFVRATMLQHAKPYMRWAYIIAPVAHRLAALPKDGLYEFDALAGFRHLSGNIHVGEQPSSILRTPQWGPGGDYGFSTSMEPTHFPVWLAEERTKTKSYGEPSFALFAHMVNERCPETHVYTAAQSKQRDTVCATVMREITAMSAEELEVELGKLPVQRPQQPAARRMQA